MADPPDLELAAQCFRSFADQSYTSVASSTSYASCRFGFRSLVSVDRQAERRLDVEIEASNFCKCLLQHSAVASLKRHNERQF